ncbi:MAG: hypothetical protein ACI8ZM_003831 [Crocinitomix sp.]|jgi:hypothetical protein
MRYLSFLLFFVAISCLGNGAELGTDEEEEQDLFDFAKEILTCVKDKDYDALMSLYITEDEFIQVFEFYGETEVYAKSEYEQNVQFMTE